MGLTQVAGWVKRPDGRGRAVRVLFLVDTGALYTVLPERVWRALKLRPTSTAEFGLANGTALVRGVSEARFEIARRTATSPVVLGEGDDAPLLGAVTLETLRLMVNPLTREVRPMGLLQMYRALGCGGRAGEGRAARARGRVARPGRRGRRRSAYAGPRAAVEWRHPGSAAPNRSGDGAPASPHRRLGSRC